MNKIKLFKNLSLVVLLVTYFILTADLQKMPWKFDSGFTPHHTSNGPRDWQQTNQFHSIFFGDFKMLKSIVPQGGYAYSDYLYQPFVEEVVPSHEEIPKLIIIKKILGLLLLLFSILTTVTLFKGKVSDIILMLLLVVIIFSFGAGVKDLLFTDFVWKMGGQVSFEDRISELSPHYRFAEYFILIMLISNLVIKKAD